MTTPLAREIQSFPAAPTRTEAASLDVRPLGPADGALVADALEGLSARSRQMRFAAPMPTLPDRLVRYLGAPDGRRHVALGVFAGGRLAAMGRFVRLADDPTTAEVALTVTDRWQGRGLGPTLLRRLAGSARELGVERFAFTVSGDNRPAQKMLGRLGVALRYASGLGEGFLPVAALLEDRTAPEGSFPRRDGSGAERCQAPSLSSDERRARHQAPSPRGLEAKGCRHNAAPGTSRGMRPARASRGRWPLPLPLSLPLGAWPCVPEHRPSGPPLASQRRPAGAVARR